MFGTSNDVCILRPILLNSLCSKTKTCGIFQFIKSV